MTLVKGFERNGEDLIQVVQSQLDEYSLIRKITENCRQKDPFYILNVNEIIRRHENWKKTMPRVEPYYAVKCNDTRIVLEILAALGTGFDCASEGEIRKVLTLGVHPNRIIFANPTKNASHMEYAAKNGVTKMTFDSEYELHKIQKTYPDAQLLIRIRYDDTSAKYILGQKYGCEYTTEALELLRVAYALDLDVVGVCFHIGSSSKDGSTYERAIGAVRHVFDLAATVGYTLEILDIGGGFPGEKKRSIEEIGDIVNPALEKYFPDTSIKIISEPGRYYVNTAFTLASNIHSKKKVVQIDPLTKKRRQIFMYYANVSVYAGLISVLFEEYYTMKPLIVDSKSESHPSVIWGTTLDATDKISEGIVMLPEMEAGDWLVIEETGAYSVALACEFNSFPVPKIHSIVDEDGCLLLTEKVSYAIPRDRFIQRDLGNLKNGITLEER